jgi:WD40 repeat protein
MSTEHPFQFHIEKIVSQYEQLLAENRQLKERIAQLQAQQAQNPQLPRPATDPKPAPVPGPTTSLMAKILRKSAKPRLQVEWVPLQYDFSDAVLCLQRTPNAVAFGTVDGKVVLLANDTFSVLSSYGGHRSAVNCIAHNHSTNLFASCSGDGTTHIWSHQEEEGASGARRGNTTAGNSVLAHHNGPVNCGAWLANGGVLVTGSSDASVCFWDVTHSQHCTHFESLSSPILSLDAAGERQQIAFGAGLASGEVRFFDTRMNGSVLSVSHSKGQVVSCHFVDDDFPHFISAGTDKSVVEWDLRHPSDSKRSFDIDHVPTKIDVAGKHVAVPCETGRVRLINLNSASLVPLGTMPFSYAVSSSAFLNDDASKLMLASWDGSAAYTTLSVATDAN